MSYNWKKDNIHGNAGTSKIRFEKMRIKVLLFFKLTFHFSAFVHLLYIRGDSIDKRSVEIIL